MTKGQRRKILVKRVAVGKLKETWRRKRASRGEPADPVDDFGGLPETDAVLDELPESLVG